MRGTSSQKERSLAPRRSCPEGCSFCWEQQTPQTRSSPGAAPGPQSHSPSGPEQRQGPRRLPAGDAGPTWRPRPSSAVEPLLRETPLGFPRVRLPPGRPPGRVSWECGDSSPVETPHVSPRRPRPFCYHRRWAELPSPQTSPALASVVCFYFCQAGAWKRYLVLICTE